MPPMSRSEGFATDKERDPRLERRKHVVLICPDNDPEARMIFLLAERMGMAILRSSQLHGATLSQEKDLLDRIERTEKAEVWIVEMPGPEIEQTLRDKGFHVHVIDHHAYGELDRATDSVSHERKRSSLEQFIAEADITDEELCEWGYSPKIVKGIGILDDRFGQGLRDEGYSQEEITRVVDAGTKFSREMNPVFDEIAKAAEEDWNRREIWNGYIVIRSSYFRDVRGAIAHLTLREGMDTFPLVISSCGGKKIFVQNVDPAIVKRLQKEIPPERTFTFGSGKCWGYDARGGSPTVTLEQVLGVLEKTK